MDNVALDVVIGLVFIYLLFSILLTSISEFVINHMGRLRGRNLHVAVKSAFGARNGFDSTADALVEKFFSNGLISSLFEGSRRPSELPAELFSKAFLAVLGGYSGPTDRPSTPGEFLSRLRRDTQLPNHDKIVGALDPLLAGAETSWDAFECNVANWFAQIGERSRGWYKRKLDWFLLVLAFLLAFVANVDTLFIVKMLQLDQQHRELLASQAARYVAEAEGKSAAKADAPKSPVTQRMERRDAFDTRMVTALVSLRDSILDSEALRTALYNRCKGQPPDKCDLDPYRWYEKLETVRKAVFKELSPRNGVSPDQAQLSKLGWELFELSSNLYLAYPDPARKEDAEIQKKIRALRPAIDEAARILQQQIESMGGAVLAAEVQRVCENRIKAAKKEANENKERQCIELYQMAVSGKLGFPIGWSPALTEFQKIITRGGMLGEDNDVWWMSGEKFFGLLLTTFALMLGAPFWFDVLRRVVALRTSGGKAGESANAESAAAARTGGSSPSSQPAVGAPASGSSWFADAVNDVERRLSTDVIRQIQARLEVTQITGRLDQATRDAIYQWRLRRRRGSEPSWELDESMIRELLWTTSDPLQSDAATLPAVTVLPASDGPMEDLKLGSHGPEVVRLRGLLAAKGFLEATGSAGEDFDTELERAVKNFQTTNGLSYDGSVGPQTWLKLSNDPDKLPAAYSRPIWMARAIHEIGVVELSGAGNDNPRILEYQKMIGATADDEIAWCSSFANWVIKGCGMKPTGSPVASSWRNWGFETPARYGAIIVVLGAGRPDPGIGGTGAHVGFLVRETSDRYLILAGNQGGGGSGDSVCVTSFPKSGWRCLAMRWPGDNSIPEPATGNVDKQADGGLDNIDIEPARRLVDTLTEPRLGYGSGNATAVAQLQRLLGGVEVDGIFGKETEDALLAFQKTNRLPQTGVADPATWHYLLLQSQEGQSSPPYSSGTAPLSFDEISKAIADTKVELAAVVAVLKVESSGRGFVGGNPLVRLEGHKLWAFAKELGIDPARWISEGAGLLHPERTGKYNRTGQAEWDRLVQARALCEKMLRQEVPPNSLGVVKPEHLADISASWGLFQIMGFNWRRCGVESVENFVRRMQTSEAEQLNLFFGYLKGCEGAFEALVNLEWATFAKLYNGPAFRENSYDTKLERAYAEAKQRQS
ncbi:MAG: TIGR02594 family protein [Candidatus Accumulibacter sp.]|uniref:TIGR02594 family protein n=1 Tax=Accumulibacter sp. TaxID=2053492 RepID=UPI00258362F1|nr:TIGR02594 family protein [Accumulibacter sp.]MCM8620203.1 TIGR02594 family protein [Accumulibacter sp.]